MKNSFYLRIQQLKKKHELYSELCQSTEMDKNGFVDYKYCDSLLFSCLTNIGIGKKFNVRAAQDKSGAWLRRPLEHGSCWPEGSGSSISRDMFTGLIFYIWRSKDLDLANELFDYGQKNNWIMGQGDVARIYFTPRLQATLSEIIYRLGGKNRFIRRHIPQMFTKTEGFAAHLDVLHMRLREELLGKQIYKKMYKYHANRQPQNPLFKILAGQYQSALNLLLDDKYFPNNRLPNTKDRRESWITQRDMDNWHYAPVPEDEPTVNHHGGDFLFASHLLLLEFDNKYGELK